MATQLISFGWQAIPGVEQATPWSGASPPIRVLAPSVVSAPSAVPASPGGASLTQTRQEFVHSRQLAFAAPNACIEGGGASGFGGEAGSAAQAEEASSNAAARRANRPENT
ncbi:hypothetical protein SAMN05444581_104122 [Methylocapsa palsarum]|uniref:Uncharacterized protein n=1 Tax=Methylocapsa palsarum TaxID=1612308 RepID=A0A1I3XX80_9HYPH|nr:hypothetical protein SAMN05444581_104122 [Methylocapsa palsarum]